MDSDNKQNVRALQKRVTPFMKQLYASIAVSFMVIACGTAMGYSGVLLPQLEDEDSNIKITPTTSSWIGSIPGTMLPFANVLGGWWIERLGRKRTTQLTVVPMTVGWIVIAMSNDLRSMLIGRLLHGVTMGVQATVSSIYIGEISSPRYRTLFLSLISTSYAAGILISQLLGTFLHWRTAALFCSLFSFLCGVMITFAPETPSWLVSKTKIDKATRSFVWYRGEGEMNELNAMVDRKLKENLEKKQIRDKSIRRKIKDLMSTLGQREFYMPLFLMFNFFVLLQYSGNNVISFYSILIIRQTMGRNLNEYAIMIVLDLIRLISSIFAGFILSRLRRKTAILVSGSLSFLCLVGLSIFPVLLQNGYVSVRFSWIPAAFLSILMIALAIGVVPLPWSILGEIFPLKSRSLGVFISTLFVSTLFFLATNTAPFMFEYWGMPVTFCCYAGVTLVTVSIIYYMIPDTRFRTLLEIEDEFSNNNKTSHADKPLIAVNTEGIEDITQDSIGARPKLVDLRKIPNNDDSEENDFIPAFSNDKHLTAPTYTN